MSESLKEYLKRYESNNEEEKKKNKKKKKKRNTKPEAAAGVSVVDEDPVWAKPVNLEEEEDNDSPDEEPQVDEDIEVKRLKRLEQIRAKRPFNSIADDGSGWVSLDKPSQRRNDTPSPSPEPRGRSREREGMSPPRRQVKRDHNALDSDISPPRKQRARSDLEDEDFSPPRRPRARARYDSPSPEPDESRAATKNVDLSPPRKKRKDVIPSGSRDPTTRSTADISSLNEDLSPPRKKRANPSGPAATKDLPRTGLVSGRDISEEISRKKKDDRLRFEEMDADMSGKGAEPVYRGKKGERISKDEYLKSKEKKVEKPKEINIEWGKGLAQKREAEAKLQELELEKEKPFARTRDDPQLDKMLKERVRWGDPMAHLVKNKQYEPDVSNLGDDERMKASGFIIPQGIPNHSWLKRGLPAAPNRYGIKPGRHWDGVDRSSGYEKEFFKRTNDKQATEREAYLWSVADM